MGFQKGNKINVGKKCSEETKKKISEANKIALKGNKIWLGRKHKQESKEKMRLAHLGEKSPNYKKDKIRQIYSVDWNETLRRSIRERDGYTCKLCGKQQGDVAHSVHHIDYNKLNSSPENLVTLCNSCHYKTNHNREYWTEYFSKKNYGI